MTPEVKDSIIDLMEKMRRAASPAKRIIVPVSGGSDSALIFNLLSEIYPEKTIGVYIGNNLREKEWFECTGNLTIVDTDLSDFEPQAAEAYRWFALLSYSLKHNGWLVGSRTRTEKELGSYSLASRVATYLPLADIWKTDVMLMCEAIGIPKSITDSSRRADPDCGRPQEMAEIPLELIDEHLKFLIGILSTTSATETQQMYLNNIVNSNKFKQHLPVKH